MDLTLAGLLERFGIVITALWYDKSQDFGKGQGGMAFNPLIKTFPQCPVDGTQTSAGFPHHHPSSSCGEEEIPDLEPEDLGSRPSFIVKYLHDLKLVISTLFTCVFSSNIRVHLLISLSTWYANYEQSNMVATGDMTRKIIKNLSCI